MKCSFVISQCRCAVRLFHFTESLTVQEIFTSRDDRRCPTGLRIVHLGDRMEQQTRREIPRRIRLEDDGVLSTVHKDKREVVSERKCRAQLHSHISQRKQSPSDQPTLHSPFSVARPCPLLSTMPASLQLSPPLLQLSTRCYTASECFASLRHLSYGARSLLGLSAFLLSVSGVSSNSIHDLRLMISRRLLPVPYKIS